MAQAGKRPPVKVALIDYRAGNLTSVEKAFAALGADLFIPAAPPELERADAIVVPGVGHFAATGALDGAWVRAIRASLERGRPLLGICLGMQWLYERSDESPDLPGLGIFRGRCSRLPSEWNGASVKIPHVGWNSLAIRRRDSIVDQVAAGSQVYFTHSFAAPITPDTVAVTEHGREFAAVVQRGSIAGVQFHPEKSGEVGLQVLRNFLELAR